ncbi:MAG TPA: precorrin-3B synthase [Burkholderiales bacterium]|nr:precorrin-3B synthase [Burkholderiales bacterium]
MSLVIVRGACPRLSAPMPTGDGLLARLAVAGPVPIDAFARICALAREHGNGVMEISARGSLQVRGLTPHSAPLFAETVAALDIDLCESVPVIASPLPGDPAALIDADATAAALRHAVAERALALAPKVSVVIDDGSALHLDDLTADIRLRAAETASGATMHIALAGDASSATPLGMVAEDAAIDVAVQLLSAIAVLGSGARAADLLRAGGIGGIRDGLGARVAPAAALPARKAVAAIGLHRLKDSTCALGLGLAFGHADANTLIAFADIARAKGAAWARPAPRRALLVGPLTATEASAVRQVAARLGFIVEANDSRRRIVACPGSPSCASGLIPARAIAAELARHLPATVPLVHVSGCAKGCAHPAAAPLNIVGTARGCGIVRDGTAREAPEALVATDDLAAAFASLTSRREAINA